MQFFLVFLALAGLAVSYYRVYNSGQDRHHLVYFLPFWHAFLCLLVLLAVALIDKDYDFSSFSVFFALLSVLMAVDMELRVSLATAALFLTLFCYYSIPSGTSYAIPYVLTAGALIEFVFFCGRLFSN